MAALVLPWNISLEKVRAKLSELSLLDRLRLGKRACRERPSTKRHSISLSSKSASALPDRRSDPSVSRSERASARAGSA